MDIFLTVLIPLVVVLVIAVASRPEIVTTRGGRFLAVVALLALPAFVTAFAASEQLHHATSTQFCLSCHEMAPYGKSLRMDDPTSICAVHFQNRYVPLDRACFSCHTTYTMFGGARSKMRGVRHVVAHYFHPPKGGITLYSPYNNRECLHCHEGARRFEEGEEHAAAREELRRNEMSCLDCHDTVHRAKEVDGLPVWIPEEIEPAPSADRSGAASESDTPEDADGEGDSAEPKDNGE